MTKTATRHTNNKTRLNIFDHLILSIFPITEHNILMHHQIPQAIDVAPMHLFSTDRTDQHRGEMQPDYGRSPLVMD